GFLDKQKKIALINDLSCLGRCSLTAALPIVSSCGFESVPLPTGVFSAHTEFDGYVCTDLTDKISEISEHWQKLGVRFDCIYTGYLASIEQAEIVKRFMLDFKKSDTVCVVDPVMGDNGKFYKRIDGSFIDEMRFLCSFADIITPNVTEAEMLAGEDCTTGQHDMEHIKDLIMKLRSTGAVRIVITGVDFGDGQIGCAAYDSISGKANMFFTPKVEGRFPGTGDVFTSSLTAAFMSGRDFIDAVQLAMSFTSECVEYTSKSDVDRKYGLCFEPFISEYSKAVKS
ncbi:MAG: pyridoxamine kinase, partial [Ruminococcus sp.]|nr:pyridoxamine kinase [Candidatus Copronaster equi]